MEDSAGLAPGARRDRILQLLADRTFVEVAELAARFEVSEVTTRSDLDSLEQDGRLRRVRGGAVAVPATVRAPERSFLEELGRHAGAKEAIGRAVAAMVEPGATIGLDVGTTTTAVARGLAAREELEGVVVVTSSISIALELEQAVPRLTVLVTGGTLRPRQHSLVDPLADLVLDELHLDMAVLGCNGVHPAAGITNVNLPEAAVKQRLLRRSRRRVVAADGSKLGQVAFSPIARLQDVDVLVTDTAAPPGAVDELRAAGLVVQQVPDPAA